MFFSRCKKTLHGTKAFPISIKTVIKNTLMMVNRTPSVANNFFLVLWMYVVDKCGSNDPSKVQFIIQFMTSHLDIHFFSFIQEFNSTFIKLFLSFIDLLLTG